MNRIDQTFIKLREEKKTAFIPFIEAGDPDKATTLACAKALIHNGADILELGVPFSDPLADGPTIQRAACRALENGISLDDVFSLVRTLRKESNIPIVLLTYYNVVYAYGVKNFIRDALKAGVNGAVIPDLPPDEADEYVAYAREKDFATIFLLAPTSTSKRITMVCRASTGFIYYVAVTGITGVRDSLPKNLLRDVRAIKKRTKKPLCVGFGIATSEQARAIAGNADGVIVGSRLVNEIEAHKGKDLIAQKVGALAKKISQAL